LDIPGLIDLISAGALSHIKIHWDIDDYVGGSSAIESENAYLKKLRFSQSLMLEQADAVTASTDFIFKSFGTSSKFHLVRNSVPSLNWNNNVIRNPSSFLFFGLNVHSSEVEKLNASFDEIPEKVLKDSKLSIELVGDFRFTLNKVFKVIPIPDNFHYYPRFARWLSSASKSLTGLILIENSELNKGKSAMKFLEYSAMGMASVGYKHAALVDDETSATRVNFIERDNPARQLLSLAASEGNFQDQATSNYQEIQNNRDTGSDTKGMTSFYNEHFLT
jgi:hypothetical protein